MRCIECRARLGGKGNPKILAGRCGSCGHAIAFSDPAKYGVSDSLVNAAIEKVSGKGAYFYLPAQSGYELLRMHKRRSKKGRWYLLIAMAVVPLSIALIVLLLRINDENIVASVIAALAGMWIIKILMSRASKLRTKLGDIPGLLKRFERANPPKHGVPQSNRLIQSLAGESPSNLDSSADRVLVCEDERFVDFFLANQFQLHNACPVLGPNRYPKKLHPNLVDRLRTRPEVDVFVLHNLTLAGIAFAQHVRESPDWFGGDSGANIIDVGLSPEHQPIVRDFLRPLSDIADGNEAAATVPGLPPNMGAELASLRPKTLLTVVARALEERGPLRSPKESGSDGGNESVWIGSGGE